MTHGQLAAAQLAVACLSFNGERRAAARDAWSRLDACARARLLNFADRSGLALHLLRAGPASFPDRPAYEERLNKNRIRLAQRKQETAELLELFHEAGLRCAVLKGFTLEPDFVPAAEVRVQYDLDFLLPPADARAAFEVLCARGFEPTATAGGEPHHLPALVRKTGWEWRGDFFDPEIPAAIELHSQLWDSSFELIDVRWELDPLDRIALHDGWPTLCLEDRLAGTALHAIRHIFRGSLRLSHLYEIAYFLNLHAADETFWRQWPDRKGAGGAMGALCGACFALASAIFDVPPRESELAPAAARRWIGKHAATVLEAGRSGKAELLLQLAFVHGARRRTALVRRKLFPMSLPSPVDAVFVADERMSVRRRLLRAARQTRFVASRAVFHLRSFAGFLRLAARWYW